METATPVLVDRPLRGRLGGRVEEQVPLRVFRNRAAERSIHLWLRQNGDGNARFGGSAAPRAIRGTRRRTGTAAHCAGNRAAERSIHLWLRQNGDGNARFGGSAAPRAIRGRVEEQVPQRVFRQSSGGALDPPMAKTKWRRLAV